MSGAGLAASADESGISRKSNTCCDSTRIRNRILHVMDADVCMTSVRIRFARYFARRKCTNGKKFGCTSATRAVTNAGAAGSDVRTRILSGFIRRAGMGSSFDSDDRSDGGVMKVGDYVVYVPDGSKGIIIEIHDNLYHIVWEDHFSSWEYGETLRLQEAYP